MVGEGKDPYFLEDLLVGDSPHCSLFTTCFIFSFKNHIVSDLLIWSRSLFLFSFGFNHHLIDREAVDVVSLLLLLLLVVVVVVVVFLLLLS